VKTTMRCTNGQFTLPQGPGLGTEPHEDVWQYLRKKGSA
jgi:L-alanine-DL-glutamate epimerase-like enolase superfamily enzyme